MNPNQTIAKKRDGLSLSVPEIASFIKGFTDGTIPDYQMSALAMAIYLNGMSPAETAALTGEMLRSGHRLAWTDRGPPLADKHSTGGIGDKVSLALAPLLAVCGLRVPMISGRGLGPTGGTLDKLEAIPGFRTDLSLAEIQRQTNEIGCVITGATSEIAPADRKLYALRDVTATVASVPLITASILSKKLAEGISSLVMDVKHGSGAFMKDLASARELASSIVSVASEMGVNTTAVLTDMNQPLGRMVGNAVEVDESVDLLCGNGPSDLYSLVIELGAELLVSAAVASSQEDARSQLLAKLENGEALKKFRHMVIAQGGHPDAPRPFAKKHIVRADRRGYVQSINGEQLGLAVIDLGGGRRFVTDSIDHSIGFEILVRIGDSVDRGQPIVNVFSAAPAPEILAKVRDAFTVSVEVRNPPALIGERVRTS